MAQNIVLVDDDDKIAQLTAQSLITKGFNVSVFNEPILALDFITNNQDYNFLITDNIMPLMNGQELIEKCLHLREGIKCILATGDDSSEIHFPGSENLVTIVSKPFKRKDLILAIENLNAN